MFHQIDSIKYYTFDSFPNKGIVHGVFTRRGGVSSAPFAELNVGASVGDDLSNVKENRRRIFFSAGRNLDTIFDVYQIHSSEIVCATSPRGINIPYQRADAILTNRHEVTLFMRFADCVPVLLYDPIQRVVGIVHAGWLGTVNKITSIVIERMLSVYGTFPQNVLAAIGPSIGPDHYEIGEEVIHEVESAFGQDSSGLLIKSDEGVKFNLWMANQLLLEQSGVKEIELCAICTACNVSDWYSHRVEDGRTGRFGALFGLK